MRWQPYNITTTCGVEPSTDAQHGNLSLHLWATQAQNQYFSAYQMYIFIDNFIEGGYHVGSSGGQSTFFDSTNFCNN